MSFLLSFNFNFAASISYFDMMRKVITFDRFIRGLILVVGILLIYLLLLKLSGVLIPFFVAWIAAYMLYPLVCFFQYRCELRNRLLSIVVALFSVIGLLSVACYFIVPPVIDEFARVKVIVLEYVGELSNSPDLNVFMDRFVWKNLDFNKIISKMSVQDVTTFIEQRVPQLFSFISSSVNAVLGIIGSMISVLYMFFILMDYENMSDGAIKLVPSAHREFVAQLLGDVEQGMNSYFRGQSLIAFVVGILFSIGFTIIGLPLAIPLGLFIGFLNLVPYLQTVGILPTVLLALIKSYDTGQNIWQLLVMCLLVFAVVQTIQDAYLTPKIMGKVTGLNAAVILLSLSIWGSLLGFVGLIIALPLTTLLLSYYKRFVLEENELEKKNSE